MVLEFLGPPPHPDMHRTEPVPAPGIQLGASYRKAPADGSASEM